MHDCKSRPKVTLIKPFKELEYYLQLVNTLWLLHRVNIIKNKIFIESQS